MTRIRLLTATGVTEPNGYVTAYATGDVWDAPPEDARRLVELERAVLIDVDETTTVAASERAVRPKPMRRNQKASVS